MKSTNPKDALRDEPSATAIAVHEMKTLEKAKEVVESYCEFPKPVLYKDGRWTMQVGASGVTQLGWSATERELWIDLAIWMAKPRPNSLQYHPHRKRSLC